MKLVATNVRSLLANGKARHRHLAKSIRRAGRLIDLGDES
jgi:hypothetical protein